MKKILNFLMIAAAAVFIASCSTSADSDSSENNQTQNGGGNGGNGGNGNNGGQENNSAFSGKTVNLIYAYDLDSVNDDDAEMFTHVCIAFLQHDADSTTLKYDKNSDLSGLKSSIASFKAKHPNVKVLISYGGGDTGSENASTVLNSDLYDDLVENIAEFVNTSGVDGIDFDWEYFGSYGTYNPIYPRFVSDIKRLTNNSKIYTIAAQTGSSFYGNADIKEISNILKIITW